MAYNFVTKEPKLILIICGGFVVKRFSSAASSEAGPWQPQN
jgi:hypothetical protein